LRVAIRASSRRLPVVLELERNGLVQGAQAPHDALQVVLALPGHPDGIALDLRLDLRELVPDQLGDLLRQDVAQAAADQERVIAQTASESRQAEATRDLEVKKAEDSIRAAFDRSLDEMLRGRSDPRPLPSDDRAIFAFADKAVRDYHAATARSSLPRLSKLQYWELRQRLYITHSHLGPLGELLAVLLGHVLPHRLNESQVGQRERALLVAVADQRLPTAHADVCRQLICDRRLADARLAHNHQQRSLPGQRFIEGRLK